MQQCSVILDVKKVPEYSDTRFLNMYTIVESITDQFPVIEKVVRLDKAETELKQIVSSKFMPVHLDQFVVHIKPLYDLTKATQGLNGSIYDLLVLFFGVYFQTIGTPWIQRSIACVVLLQTLF